VQAWDVLCPDPAVAWLEGLKGAAPCCQLPLETLCISASAQILCIVIKIMAMQCKCRSEWILLPKGGRGGIGLHDFFKGPFQPKWLCD